MAVEKGNVVVVEHEFAVPVAKVFGALREGRLFLNCGAWPENTHIDFRKGGKYELNFAHHGKSYGEFTEIVENKHVAFTWSSDAMEVKGTRVSIDLTPSPKGCKLKLRHEGFSDLEMAEAHEGGWTSGLEGCDLEMTKYRVHFEREIVTPVEKLFDTCAGMIQSGEIHGEIVEIEKNKKIALTWKASKPATKVTLEFGPWGDEGKNSYIELSHEGITNAESALAQHKVWNSVLWNIYKKLCH
jgi:uncharacterized protein YndB with AHSA1/START domain